MAPKRTKAAPPSVVEEEKAFGKLIQRLQTRQRLAIDTEAASFHRYDDRIYLIQVSSDRDSAVIDPLAIKDLRPFGKLLADPNVEVVFHDADYDLRVLDRDYKFRAKNIFDTRIAAQLLGEPGVGLGALLEKHFGVKLDKRMQRADWSKRPLTPEMIEYAWSDTHHLLALRDKLETELTEAGRLPWAQEEFKLLERVRWGPANADGQGFLRVKGAKLLTRRSLAVLRAVYNWRDAKAKELDRAPFRVLGNDTMIAVAKAAPIKKAALAKVSRLPASTARRYGEELTKTVTDALATPESDYPKVERGKRPKTNRTAEARLHRLKSLRDRRARALKVEAGVLCPNGTLQAIARAGPSTLKELHQIDGLRRWQCDALEHDALLAEVNGAGAASGPSGSAAGKNAAEAKGSLVT